LPESVKTLYTTIQAELGDEVPQALMVFGLESVSDLSAVLTSSNYVREEFRNNFPLPLLLWVNDEVLQKLIQLAPDFESWATTTDFAIATEELIDSLHKNADYAFTRILGAGAGRFLDNAVLNIAVDSRYRSELTSALRDLQSRVQELDPELEANLRFLLGRDAQANGQMEKARQHYEQSLAFWQQSQNTERHGGLLFYLGLWWRRYAVLHRAEYLQACRQARDYFRQCIEVFQQGNRPDLAAKFINPLGEVLARLEDWDELEVVAKTSVQLHQTYQDTSHLASSGYAYGLLAEVALKRSDWSEAKNYAELALQRNADPIVVAYVSQIVDKNKDWAWSWKQYQSFYLLLLAKSQQHLGEVKEAVSNLETARDDSNPQYDPQLYIDVLKELRSLYFDQGEYLKAFEVKQEQKSIEAQYGFRPFIGAGSLRPIKRVINPALEPADPKVRARERITASGRRSDVSHLIERLSRNDYKLIVIHGMSGVGKSSLLWAGLLPELKQNPIGDRNALPVTLRYYTNWVRELGKRLEEAFREIGIGQMDICPGAEPPQPPLLRGEQEPTEIGRLRTLDPPQPPLTRGEQEGTLPLIRGEQEEKASVSREREVFKQESPPFEGGLGGSIDSTETIIEQLKKNANRNLLTVLIFDQFEEFFFACTNLVERRPFYEFLKACLNLPYVKVIMSLREDYLHYLLECDRFANLDVINNNILDKNIRYYLRDFPPERAKSVILELTERSQFYLEPALVDELVRNLAGELGEVRPIELQVVGAQLQTENITTLEQYHQLGANPKEKLVQRSLEEIIKDCGAENERAARLVLYLLTNENGTRPLKTRAELEADLEILGFESEAKQLDLVLEVLVGSGLVFLLPESPENRYQLVHDYLVAFIRQQQAPGLLAELAEAKEKQKLTEAQMRQALREKDEALQKEQEERKRAEIAEIEALNSLSQVLWLSHKQLEALLAIVKAGKKLHGIAAPAPSELKAQIRSQLYQTINQLQERNRFQGHCGPITSVSFSSDGQTIASASNDAMVKLWRIDGTLIQTFKGHKDRVYHVSFSPDGQIIASASRDCTMKLWRIDGTLIQTFKGHKGRVISVAWSPDGHMLASSSSGDRTVKLWRIDGTLIQTFKGHTGRVISVSWNRDGQMLASASGDGTVKLWHVDGAALQTLEGHGNWVNSVAWSPDGQTLASASSDGTVKLWHVDGAALQTLEGHGNWVNSVAWSPDGQMLASASSDCTVKLWHVDGTVLQTLKGHGNWVNSVAWSPDGQMLASASDDATVKLWRLDDTQEQTFQRHKDWVRSVSFSPDGQMIASASSDGTVKLWCLDGTVLQILDGHSRTVYSLAWSPDGQMLASASGDCTVKLWLTNGTLMHTFEGHRDRITTVAWSPNGQMLTSASDDRTVKLWLTDGTVLQTLEGHNSTVYSVAWSPDGQMIASASSDGTVKLWLTDGTVLQTFKEHSDRVRSATFSPDGQLIASASGDGMVKLWRIDGTPLQTFKGHTSTVYSIAWSPDGQAIASASSDGTVKLWRLDGTPLQTFKGHTSTVYSIAWSPDGEMIASASGDSTVKLWPTDGKEWNLDLDEILVRGCDRLRDYLKTNPNVSQSDRALCEGMRTK
jgi:WD40 repeat protein